MGRTVRIGGTHRTVICRWVRVSGTWRRVPYRYTRVGGAWKTTKIISDCSFSGAFNGTGAAPGPVTGPLRTVTVPAGNPGDFTLASVVVTGVTFKVSVNGAAYVTCTNGYAFTLSNGQSLQFQIQGGVAFDGASCGIVDATTGVTVAGPLMTMS